MTSVFYSNDSTQFLVYYSYRGTINASQATGKYQRENVFVRASRASERAWKLSHFHIQKLLYLSRYLLVYYTGWPRNNGTVDTVDFSGLLYSTVSFFTLLNRASISHYNNTKIIEFG